MAYLDVDDPGFMTDIQRRREFASLRLTRENLDKEPLTFDDEDATIPGLIRTSSQLFAGNFMNADTPAKRLLLKWSTGIGKTIGALSVATSMIAAYQRIQQATGQPIDRTPSVFVIGFTRERVIDDLLKFPEFGFVTPTELRRQRELNKAALAGGPAQISIAKDHYVMLRRRVTNKAKGGYFRFFGYQELVNRVFGIGSRDQSTSELIALLYSPDFDEFKKAIDKATADGKIQLNKQIIDEFNHSFVIVDEIHNAYSSRRMNSWGATVAYVLDAAVNTRAIMMSATPATNSVTEYIDVINLITADPKLRLRHKEWGARFTTLETSALEQLATRMTGRVSFLQDSDVNAYPKLIFDGKPLVIDGSEVPYLKFVLCPMSKLQIAAYADFEQGRTSVNSDVNNDVNSDDNDATNTNDDDNDAATKETDDDKTSKPTQDLKERDDYYIRDIAIVNPGDGPPLFRARETKAKLSNASTEWRDKHNIDVVDGVIVGEFLAPDAIGEFSSKYKAMVDRLLATPGGEKIMIYHNYVKMSGVLLIAEVLRRAGYVDIDTAPHERTLCSMCGMTRAKGPHVNAETNAEAAEFDPKHKHVFYAARFGVVHGEQPGHANQRVFRTFNDPTNIRGRHMRVLIGAQMIRESADLRAVRHMFIMAMPINIKMLQQVIGRGVRKNSHVGLPAADWTCTVALFVTTFGDGKRATVEELGYKTKVCDYITIQNAEKTVHAVAIDASIHRDIIMSPEVLHQYGLERDPAVDPYNAPPPTRHLGPLFYTPEYPANSDIITNTTYYAYGRQAEEIRLLERLIIKSFIATDVWTYDGLWEAVQKPEVRTEISPASFSEDNLVVALSNVMKATQRSLPTSWAVRKIGIYYIKAPKIRTEPGAPSIVAPDAGKYGSGAQPLVRVSLDDALGEDAATEQGISSLERGAISALQLSGLPRREAYADLIADHSVRTLEQAMKRVVETRKDTAAVAAMRKLFVDFNMLVKGRDVPATQRKELGLSSDATIVGYLSSNGPMIKSGTQWRRLAITSADMMLSGAKKEAPPIIGYMEELPDGRLVFKIRRTLQSIAEEVKQRKITDARLVERGAVCTTRPRGELEGQLKTLSRRANVQMPDTRSVKEICVSTRHRLMLSDAFVNKGAVRTFYWFHERVPQVSIEK